MKTFFRPWRALRVAAVMAAIAVTALEQPAQAAAAVSVKTLGGGPNQSSTSRYGFANGDTLLYAKFYNPFGVAVDTNGNLLIADRSNNKIRKITKPGAGDSLTSVFASGLRGPIGVAVDASNYVYVVTAGDGKLRKFNGSGNLLSTLGGFVSPTALALGKDGDIFVTELGGRIRRVSASGALSTLISGLRQPRGITLLPSGLLAVTESANHAIYTVHPVTGAVTLIAGGNGRGFNDGAGLTAQFNTPHGIAASLNGSLVVADRLNHKVRLIDSNNVVSTLYGIDRKDWPRSFPGWVDGAAGPDGVAASREPVGVVVGTNGMVYTTEFYWQLIRQASGANLLPGGTPGGGTGGGTTTNLDGTLVAPTFSPSSGYFPGGVSISVTSTVPVYYTFDGTEPTTNSRQVTLSGTVGTIRFSDSLRDLSSLRLKGILGAANSATVGGTTVSTNEIGLAKDIVGGIGSELVVPLVINARTNDQIKSVQFRVEVTPLNGAPPVLPQLRAISISSNDFIQVKGAAAPNTIGHYSYAPYTVGATRGLVITAIGTNANFEVKNFAAVAMLVVPIDPSAMEGHSYSVEVLYPSATSDGNQATVPLVPMPPRTITVMNVPYLVGDSSPSIWYNAGEFGNGDLGNDDVNTAFYSVNDVRAPFSFTDAFNTIDTYPPDDDGFAGGDGELTYLDWQYVLGRSLRLNSTNWVRRWADGGLRTAERGTLTSSAARAAKSTRAKVAPVVAATIEADVLENAIPNVVYSIPVRLHVDAGQSVAGLSFRASVTPNNGAPAIANLTFTPFVGLNNFVTASAVGPNEVLCGWTMVPAPAFSPSLQGNNNVLGTLNFRVPAESPRGQSYSIHFHKGNGAADLVSPVEFQEIPGSVWVATGAAATTPAK